MSTNKKCVKAYLKESDYKRLKQFASERDISVSSAIGGLLHFYRSYKYFPNHEYNFKYGYWYSDQDEND